MFRDRVTRSDAEPLPWEGDKVANRTALAFVLSIVVLVVVAGLYFSGVDISLGGCSQPVDASLLCPDNDTTAR